jgi:hypothetical protein
MHVDKQTDSNYLSEWFSAVPARWYAMLLILITLVGGTVFAALWVNSKGLDWWWTVLYIVVVILFIVFSYLAYRKAAIDRDKVTLEKNKLNSEMSTVIQERDTLKQELTKSRLTPSAHTYIPDSFIQGRSIYLLDLIAPGSRPVIQKRTIEDCEIRGPAMIGFLGTVNLDSNCFDGDMDSLFVEVELNRTLLGIIGLEDCTIRRCRFVAIGIIGVKQQIDQLKKGYNPQGVTPDQANSQTA